MDSNILNVYAKALELEWKRTEKHVNECWDLLSEAQRKSWKALSDEFHAKFAELTMGAQRN